MDQGWLVLDPVGRIADLNPAAERLFGVVARWAIGREASDALRGVVGLDRLWRGDRTHAEGPDVRVTAIGPERELDVHVTPLLSPRGALLGRMLLVRDVTDLRRAEAQALDRERALATLQERERVARELHDGVAQVLGFVRLQAEAARGLLRRDPPTAETYLSRLAETALEAHGEVRSFIAGSASGSDVGWLAAIATTARRLREGTGLEVEVRVPPAFEDGALDQRVGAHVVRIVQEALHNVRKHARASRVRVSVEVDDVSVGVVVADDGTGLGDPLAPAGGTGFGLRFMQERAEAAGGTLVVASGPAGGTQVTLRVPRRGMPALPAAAAEAGHGVG
jgi:PAS domain S-box-containing protein